MDFSEVKKTNVAENDVAVRGDGFLGHGIATFVLCAFFICAFAYRQTSVPEQRHVFLIAAGFATFFGLSLWGGIRLTRNFGASLLLTVASCAAALALRFPILLLLILLGHLVVLFRTSEKWRFPDYRWMAPVIVLAAGYALVILGTNQLTDIFFSSKMLVGQYNTDSFFHIAIAALIKNFGQAGTGAHGLVGIDYYTFSHYLFAAMAYVASIPTMDSYAALYTVVWIPLLFLCLSAAAESLIPSRTLSEYWFRLAFIGLLFAGFLGFGPNSISSAYAVWVSFFESESYTLSLILLLAMLTIFSIENLWGKIGLAGVFLVLMCLTKASTATIAYGLCAAYLVFIDTESLRKRAVLLLFVTLCIVVGLKSVSGQSSEIIKFEYLEFFRSYVRGLSPQAPSTGSLSDPWFRKELFRFFVVHFFFSWISFALLANACWFFSPGRFLRRSALLFNAAALAAGLIAVIVLALPAGAVYYFTNVSMFIAFPFILANMGQAFSEWRSRPRAWRRLVLPLLVLVFAVHDLPKQGRALVLAGIKKSETLPATADRDVYAAYLGQLRAIQRSQLPFDMLVYIAKENTGFWGARTTAACKAQSFVIPALSERPALFGLVDKSRCEVAYYGFNKYPERAYLVGAESRVSETELLAETSRLGFKGYIDVTPSGYTVHYLLRQVSPNK